MSRTQYGLPGVYNASPITLADGEGSALAVNENGELLVTITLAATVFDLTNSDPLAVAIVDATGDQITSFGGGTQYATNVAYADGNTGTLALVIRDDALTTLTEADGDYSALRVSSTGALHVTGGSSQYAIDAIAGASDSGNVMIAVRDDTTPGVLTPAEGDYTNLKTDANGSLWVTLGSALAKTQDSISAAIETNVLMDGTTSLTVKRVAVSAATSGNNTLVAAVIGKNIRVISCFLVVAGAVDVRFEDGAAGTALTGIMSLASNSGLVLPHNPTGWFETSDNTLLNLELGSAVQVSGSLSYIEV